ncbi:unnamed protein product [Rotaria socialis]|uniref:Uncharacterized protein n=1 Tax=Rotaria socialis TaxID=392032 RepID=A0A818CYB5_9BILA|nr:unnamed protein product [Rotaria socialis]CAF3451591.1 unnamed protein product [Rotaria socialis]CAF3556076.1 unnamed protein product [Rotaria socialis]CAF4315894.1 unnamed protein product [Rotaria socialis]CAF4333852.1 unnamed protein product [Rotaria socialis]
MSIIKLKSSLGYIWYRIGCFLIEIYCHIDNLGIIRYFDSTFEDKTKETIVILCLILIAFTIVSSSISTVFSFLNGFGNSIEDYPFYSKKYNKKIIQSLPLLSLFDIHISILILLPKILINSQLINAKIKDQNLLFESSIDFIVGNAMKRVKKDGELIIILDSNPYPAASCQIINFFLFLIRYNFSYSNSFYKINKYLSLIMIVHSIISILLILLTYGTFEILFKIESIVNYSINIYSYFLITSLMISILLILLTNHTLFHFGLTIYSQKQNQISNQLIHLSTLNDQYFIERSIRRSLIFYLLFVILTVICQLPFIILILKLFLSDLIDYLFIIYIVFLLLYLFISIILFTFLCLFPLSYWNFNYLNKLKENNQSKSSSSSSSSLILNRINENLEEKYFSLKTPHIIPTRSVSSCGLTVIDHEISNGRTSHPTFQQTPGVATDALLVMH